MKNKINRNNRSKNNSSKKGKNKKLTRKHLGGEIIDKGGYGCVFRPAIRCKDSIKPYNGISKLATIRNSRKEWSILEKVLKMIEQIPNYQRYFILSNMEICRPAELSAADKHNFNKCNIFQEISVNKDNINDNLDKFEIINMPYGGINLTKAMNNDAIPMSKMCSLLLELLLNAIIPMNALNVYHKDIKASNILYKDNEVKIIDYGGMVVYSPGDEFSDKFLNHPINFNHPLSVILLTPFLDDVLTAYFSQISLTGLSSSTLLLYFQKFTVYYFQVYRREFNNDVGHDEYLDDTIIPSVFKVLFSSRYKQFDLNYVLSRYCAPILLKYVSKTRKTFDRHAYITDIYLKSFDIYGLVMSFLPYVKKYSDAKTIPPKIRKTANLIRKFCFSAEYAAVPINISKLEHSIKEIIELKKSPSKKKSASKKKSESKKKKSESKKKKSESKKKKSESKKKKSESKKKKSESKKKKSESKKKSERKKRRPKSLNALF